MNIDRTILDSKEMRLKLFDKIENENGFTIDMLGREYIGSGYGVSVANNQGGLFSATYKKALKLLEETEGSYYLGGWKKNGLYYVDLTIIVEDGMRAQMLAKKYFQKEIYDFNNRKTINV